MMRLDAYYDLLGSRESFKIFEVFHNVELVLILVTLYVFCYGYIMYNNVTSEEEGEYVQFCESWDKITVNYSLKNVDVDIDDVPKAFFKERGLSCDDVMKDNNNVVIDSIDRGILKKDFRFFIYEIYGFIFKEVWFWFLRRQRPGSEYEKYFPTDLESLLDIYADRLMEEKKEEYKKNMDEFIALIDAPPFNGKIEIPVPKEVQEDIINQVNEIGRVSAKMNNLEEINSYIKANHPEVPLIKESHGWDLDNLYEKGIGLKKEREGFKEEGKKDEIEMRQEWEEIKKDLKGTKKEVEKTYEKWKEKGIGLTKEMKNFNEKGIGFAKEIEKFQEEGIGLNRELTKMNEEGKITRKKIGSPKQIHSESWERELVLELERSSKRLLERLLKRIKETYFFQIVLYLVKENREFLDYCRAFVKDGELYKELVSKEAENICILRILKRIGRKLMEGQIVCIKVRKKIQKVILRVLVACEKKTKEIYEKLIDGQEACIKKRREIQEKLMDGQEACIKGREWICKKLIDGQEACIKKRREIQEKLMDWQAACIKKRREIQEKLMDGQEACIKGRKRAEGRWMDRQEACIKKRREVQERWMDRQEACIKKRREVQERLIDGQMVCIKKRREVQEKLMDGQEACIKGRKEVQEVIIKKQQDNIVVNSYHNAIFRLLKWSCVFTGIGFYIMEGLEKKKRGELIKPEIPLLYDDFGDDKKETTHYEAFLLVDAWLMKKFVLWFIVVGKVGTDWYMVKRYNQVFSMYGSVMWSLNYLGLKRFNVLEKPRIFFGKGIGYVITREELLFLIIASYFEKVWGSYLGKEEVKEEVKEEENEEENEEEERMKIQLKVLGNLLVDVVFLRGILDYKEKLNKQLLEEGEKNLISFDYYGILSQMSLYGKNAIKDVKHLLTISFFQDMVFMCYEKISDLLTGGSIFYAKKKKTTGKKKEKEIEYDEDFEGDEEFDEEYEREMDEEFDEELGEVFEDFLDGKKKTGGKKRTLEEVYQRDKERKERLGKKRKKRERGDMDDINMKGVLALLLGIMVFQLVRIYKVLFTDFRFLFLDIVEPFKIRGFVKHITKMIYKEILVRSTITIDSRNKEHRKKFFNFSNAGVLDMVPIKYIIPMIKIVGKGYYRTWKVNKYELPRNIYLGFLESFFIAMKNQINRFGNIYFFYFSKYSSFEIDILFIYEKLEVYIYIFQYIFQKCHNIFEGKYEFKMDEKKGMKYLIIFLIKDTGYKRRNRYYKMLEEGKEDFKTYKNIYMISKMCIKICSERSVQICFSNMGLMSSIYSCFDDYEDMIYLFVSEWTEWEWINILYSGLSREYLEKEYLTGLKKSGIFRKKKKITHILIKKYVTVLLEKKGCVLFSILLGFKTMVLLEFSGVKNYIWFKAILNSLMFKDITKDMFLMFEFWDEECIDHIIFSEGCVVKKYKYIPSILYFKLEDNEKTFFYSRTGNLILIWLFSRRWVKVNVFNLMFISIKLKTFLFSFRLLGYDVEAFCEMCSSQIVIFFKRIWWKLIFYDLLEIYVCSFLMSLIHFKRKTKTWVVDMKCYNSQSYRLYNLIYDFNMFVAINRYRYEGFIVYVFSKFGKGLEEEVFDFARENHDAVIYPYKLHLFFEKVGGNFGIFSYCKKKIEAGYYEKKEEIENLVKEKDIDIIKLNNISFKEFPFGIMVGDNRLTKGGYKFQGKVVYALVFFMYLGFMCLNVFYEIIYIVFGNSLLENVSKRLSGSLNGLYVVYFFNMLKLILMFIYVKKYIKILGFNDMHLELYYTFCKYHYLEKVLLKGKVERSFKECTYWVFQLLEEMIGEKKNIKKNLFFFFCILLKEIKKSVKKVKEWKIFFTERKKRVRSFYRGLYRRIVMSDVVTQQGEVGSYTFEILWVVSTTVSIAFVVFTTWGALYTLDSVFDPVVYVKVMGNQGFWEYEMVYGLSVMEKELEKSIYYLFLGGYVDGMVFLEEFDCWFKGKNGFYEKELFIYSGLFDFYKVNKFSFLSNPVSSIELELGNRRMNTVDAWLILPVGVDIRLLVTGMDVIHSFSVPAFGVKVDAIPGRINALTFNVLEIGVYYGQCSELCGINHSFMPILIQTLDFNLYKKIMI